MWVWKENLRRVLEIWVLCKAYCLEAWPSHLISLGCSFLFLFSCIKKENQTFVENPLCKQGAMIAVHYSGLLVICPEKFSLGVDM